MGRLTTPGFTNRVPTTFRDIEGVYRLHVKHLIYYDFVADEPKLYCPAPMQLRTWWGWMTLRERESGDPGAVLAGTNDPG